MCEIIFFPGVARVDDAGKIPKQDANADIVLRIRGVPAQSGTPETDADPTNPIQR